MGSGRFPRFFPQAVDSMPESHDRMGIEHTWAGVAHHGFDPGAHVRLVAVDRATRAGGLAMPERALLQPVQGVFMQFAAVRAQIRTPAVMVMAVQAKHRPQGCGFAR